MGLLIWALIDLVGLICIVKFLKHDLGQKKKYYYVKNDLSTEFFINNSSRRKKYY